MSDFVPAQSMSEAEARLVAISGGVVDKRTRGPKRPLRELATVVGVDVPLHATNGTLGGEIAHALGVSWPGGAATGSDQVSLHGLNVLLEAAADYFATRPAPKQKALPAQFDTAEWSWFRPARSKIEAVNRISSLTGSGPEYLGPGGKERKSVLENLATRALLGVDTDLSKTELGADLATALGVAWTPTCASTGYTITLEGLNTVLAGAERHFARRAQSPAEQAERESDLLAGLLKAEFQDGHWDGRTAVAEMRDEGHSQWKHNEWPGWYFEYRGLRALHEGMGVRTWTHPPQHYGVTNFDYAYRFVWDLKAKTSAAIDLESGKRSSRGHAALLNDQRSIELCAADTGVGFLILHGESFFDPSGDFDAWHRAFVGGGPSKSSHPRNRKAGFTPRAIETYRFPDENAIATAAATGALTVMKQGRQQPRKGQIVGDPRPPKYKLHTRRARDWLIRATTLP